MEKIPTISMHRFEFMLKFAIGQIMDVGSHKGDGWSYSHLFDLHDDYTKLNLIFVDCDDHEIKNTKHRTFKAFAENIPLPDKYVDTVCLGDILEHVKDPDVVIKEAKRLSRQRILITVPNEYEWPPELHPFFIKENHTHEELELNKKINATSIDDDIFPHFYHVRFYNHDTFRELIKKSCGDDMNYILFNIKYAHNFTSFAAMMWFK